MPTRKHNLSRDSFPSFPTRRNELRRITQLLNSGSSVLVFCLPGDAPSSLAGDLAVMLQPAGDSQANVLRCSSHTRLDALKNFLADGHGTSARILVGPSLMPDSAVELIDEALQPGHPPVAFFVDPDRLSITAPAQGVGAQLATAWQKGELDRIDLAPLTDPEIESAILDRLEPGVLDDLQVRTLVALAEGQLLLARDLADDATAYPDRVQRRYPRPGMDTATFGSLALSRMEARINGLDDSLADAAAKLAQLSPLPLSTVSQLFGDSMLAQLLGHRLAVESEDWGQRTLTVSPLHSVAMAGRGTSVFDDPEFSTRIVSLWSAGYPVNEAILLGLSRSLMRSPSPISAVHAGLALAAAAAANRLGDGIEAKALLTITERCSALSQAQQTQVTLERLKAQLNLGEHQTALATAESLLADPAVDFEALYYAAVAVAWAPTTPAWWEQLLDSPQMRAWPGAATALTCFIGESTGADDPTVDMDAVGQDPANPVEVRLLALSFTCAAHANLNNAAALDRAVVTGMRLAEDVMARPSSQRSEILITLVALFQLSASISATLGGVQVERTRDAITATVSHATALTSRTGWNLAMCSGWMAATSRAVQGDSSAAELDFDYADTAVRPAFFPLMWCLHAGFSSILRSTLGHPTERTPYFTQRARQILRPRAKAALGLIATAEERDLFDFVSPDAPAWTPRMALTELLASQRMAPAEVIRILDTIPRTTLPAGLAQERYLRMAAAGDADGLMSAGTDLVATGQIAFARLAYSRARALYLGRRAAAKASSASESLAALDRATPVGLGRASDAVASIATERASVLTERELEVSQLVAEGLTNVQIAQRLVLSVRTVESHVLQARSKLGVAKRRDIPAALLEMGH